MQPILSTSGSNGFRSNDRNYRRVRSSSKVEMRDCGQFVYGIYGKSKCCVEDLLTWWTGFLEQPMPIFYAIC